jgi:hypothetical protein
MHSLQPALQKWNWKCTLLMSTPLLYVAPGEYRLYISLGIAAVFLLFSSAKALRPRRTELLLLLALAIVAVFQPAFVKGESLNFNIGWITCVAFMLVPYWAINSNEKLQQRISASLDPFLRALFTLTITTIYLSFFFGWGVVYGDDLATRRAFGWLGDSFTPVITFLIFYFALCKQYLRVLVLIGCLVLTTAKAATLLLCVMLFAFFAFSPISYKKKLLAIVCFSGFFALIYSAVGDLGAERVVNLDYSVNNRVLMNQIGWRFFVENLWWGKGAAGVAADLPYEMADTAALADLNTFVSLRIYNSYVGTAAQFGIVGLTAVLGLSLLWVSAGIVTLRRAFRLLPGQRRNMAVAGSIWTTCFIVFYQSTGWFFPGEMQLAWLLLILAISRAALRFPDVAYVAAGMPGTETPVVFERAKQ